MTGRFPRLFAVAFSLLEATLLAGGTSAAQAAAPKVEDFFRKSQYGGPSLSPSGRYLAFIAPVGEHYGVGIIDLQTRGAPRTLGSAGGDVLRVVWQNDERLIAFIGDAQGVAGEPPREQGILAVNRDGSEPLLLTTISLARSSAAT
jgi:hypothetical protein